MLLPTEILLLILKIVGGTEFLSIRRTCKRFKEIADDLEINSKPALWRRYVLRDYPRPCVESAAPWLYTADINDPFLWKLLYLRMRRMTLLKGDTLSCTHLHFDTSAVQLTQDVKFCGGYLFLVEKTGVVWLAGLDQTSWRWPPEVRTENPLTDSYGGISARLFTTLVAYLAESSKILKLLNKGDWAPCELVVGGQFFNMKNLGLDWTLSTTPELGYSTNDVSYISHTNHTMIYCCLHALDKSVIQVHSHASQEDKESRKITLKTSGINSLTFNDKRIVAVCDNKIICIIPNTTSEGPVNEFPVTVRCEVVKVCMMGDFLLVLFEDGLLETAKVATDQKDNGLTLSGWRVLIGGTTSGYPGCNRAVSDFAVQGLLFSAVLANGEVFISTFESCDHVSLERNLRSLCKIRLGDCGSWITRISMDVDDGLKVAMVETEGYTHKSRLHIVYLEKG